MTHSWVARARALPWPNSCFHAALLTVLLGMALAGCRQNPHTQIYIDSVNAEKRLLEDKLYNLQDDYDDKIEELKKLRKQLADLQQGKRPQTQEDAAPAPFPLIPRPKTKEPLIDGLKPPTIEPGKPADGGSSGPSQQEKTDKSNNLENLLQPPSLDMGHEVGSAAELSVPTDRVVTRLVVEPAVRSESTPGPGNDNGHFCILLRPQNKAGQLVPEPGRATVVLLDPVKRARVARWELDAAQVAAALKQSPATHGIKLELPWQEPAPDRARLHLFVRFWPADGELVEADREIALTLHDALVSRWTPRAPTPVKQTPAMASIAERPGRENSAAAPGTKPATSPEANTTPPSPRLTRSAEELKQATRPQWRPYR